MTDFELKDSGERRTFASGAVRDRGDIKPRPDLISPHANMREGMIYALGAQKYDVRNWEKGMPISECVASAQRHIEKYKLGLTDEDHLAQARWNLGAVIHYEEEIKAGRLDPTIDDMPKYEQRNILDDGGPIYSVNWADPAMADLISPVEAQQPMDNPLPDEMFPPIKKPVELPVMDYPPYYGESFLPPDPLINLPPTNATFCRTCGAHIPPRYGEGVCSDCIGGAGASASRHDPMKSWAERVISETPDGDCISCDTPEEVDAVLAAADREQDEYEARPQVYIAGPMRGIPDFNFPLFDEAAEYVSHEKKWRVVSPAQLDRAAGIDPGTFEETPDAVKRIIKRDLKVILQLDPADNDGMVLLPGWTLSTGARAEVALALWMGIDHFAEYRTPEATSCTTFSPAQLVFYSVDRIQHKLFGQFSGGQNA